MQVLIVDDHAFIHSSLKAVVRKAVPGTVVRTATTLAEAVTLARSSPGVGLVLLDLGLPGCTGIEALTRFRTALPKLRVAVISATEDPATVQAAYAAGAVGYIPKGTPPDVMVAEVRLIAEGGVYFPPKLMIVPMDAATKVGLTGRQGAVLKLLLKGLTNQEIARRLDIAENTVKQHIHSVFRALKVTSRTQAMIVAARLGIKSQ